MRRTAIALLVLLVLAGCGDTSPSAQPESSTSTSTSTSSTSTSNTSTTPSTSATSAGPETGDTVVVDVVDGDTIRVRLGGETESVRLVGINTPEQGECLADEAGRWLRDRIGTATVELVVDTTDRDQYGRLLRYVEVGGADVGEELVRAGLALARDYPPDTERSDVYRRAQGEAEDAAAGMWAPDACGRSTSADVAISEIRFDADGDDNQNLNDEWVRITNRSGSPVDLTGWILKDTSATHRYPFPAGFRLEPAATVTVRTGCGPDSTTDLHWCNQGSAVWNNSGDTAFLLDPSGNIVSSMEG